MALTEHYTPDFAEPPEASLHIEQTNIAGLITYEGINHKSIKINTITVAGTSQFIQ